MKSLWNAKDAQAAIDHYAGDGIASDLALRVYTTRLLGGEPKLVLHGGGNTSLKTRVTDMVGDEWEVLCVKGSGWDMGSIEPAGLPAVKLAPLRKARAFDALSDEDMADLAAYFAETGRNSCLLTAPPLRLPGAVGSPATPVATV